MQMRKGIGKLALLAICVFTLIAGSISATDYVTNRTDITVTSGTVDFNHSESNLYSPAGGAGTNITGNITLPCNIANLTTMNFTIWNNESSAILVNLSVNGVKLIDNASINAGSTLTKTLSDYTTASGDTSLSWIAWSFNASDSDGEYINITIVADNATLLTSWINSQVAIAEKDESTPTIKTEMVSSFFAVKDRIRVTNNLDFTIRNVTLNLTYPSHAISRPYSNITFTSITNGTTSTKYVGYQKRGPYVKDIEETVSGNTHTVEVRVYSYELLLNCVDWIIDPADEDYSEYFDTVNFDTLEIEKEGSDVDWENDGGNIVMEDLSLSNGYTDFTFTWTVAPAPPAPPAQPTTAEVEVDYTPYILIAIVIIVAIAVVVYAKRK